MRLTALLFTVILAATTAAAQETRPSSGAQSASPPQDDKKPELNLPFSLERIKKELQQEPSPLLRGLDDRPMFKLEVQEKTKVSLEDLINSLEFKAGPVPAGGIHMQEMLRQQFNPTSNPLAQPYAAFNQGELLTVLVENLVGKYFAGKASNAITGAMRDRAVAAARAEVQQAINDFCAAQPDHGAGIEICDRPDQ